MQNIINTYTTNVIINMYIRISELMSPLGVCIHVHVNHNKDCIFKQKLIYLSKIADWLSKVRINKIFWSENALVVIMNNAYHTSSILSRKYSNLFLCKFEVNVYCLTLDTCT